MSDIQLYNQISNPWDAIERAGVFFAKSGMFGCDRTEQGMVMAMACFAERKSPFEIAATYHLQGGRLTMKAEAMLGRFHAAGGKSRIVSRTPDKAELELVTASGNKALFSFSFDEAKSESYIYTKDGKTLKDNWSTPRRRMQMLWARVVSDGVRAMAPEILNGAHTAEEIVDDVAPQSELLLAAPTPPPIPIPAEPTQAPRATALIETPATPALTAAPQTDGDGGLSSETVKTLIEIFGANADAAYNWLVAKGWLKQGGTLRELSLQRAQKILAKPAKFIEAAIGSK